MVDYLSLLAEDRDMVAYRPKLNRLTGRCVLATIMFQQILYWWTKSGHKPFYKFLAPCSHADYREGDSWEEELGFSRSEVHTALSKIAVKVTKGVSKTKVLEENMVAYWTDRTRKTWFEVSPQVVNQRLHEHYICNAGFLHYIVNPDFNITYNSTETSDRSRVLTVPDGAPPTGENKPTKPTDPIKEFQRAFVADLYERLDRRGLLKKRALSESYRGQLAGEVGTNLRKQTASEAKLWAAQDEIIAAWEREALPIWKAINASERRDQRGSRNGASGKEKPPPRTREEEAADRARQYDEMFGGKKKGAKQ